jgi:predicted ribonuclease YlaK
MTRLLVEAEIAEQRELLLAEMKALNEAASRWTWGHLLVVDTSAVIHGPHLWTWDPADEYGLSAERVQIVLPMLVLDELDDLKENSKQHTRNRARETLKWLAEKLGSNSNVVIRQDRVADPTDGTVARGEVHLDVLLDDVGHIRLPIADDEIVDRAATVASTSGRKVTLVTNDVGQAYRARLAGLEVRAVAQPIYDVDIREDEKAAARERAREDKQRDVDERRAAQEAGRGKRDTGRPQPPHD